MLDMPKWLLEILPNIKCCVCEKFNMSAANVVAIGIRKSSKNKNNVVFFFDYACKCGKSSIIEFPDQMNLEGFVNMMVDEYIAEGEGHCENCKDHCENSQETPVIKNNKNFHPAKSKISEKEVKELKDILNKSQDFSSFLSQIGVSQELINFKKKSK